MIIHRSKSESGKKPTRLTQLRMERQRRYEAEEDQNTQVEIPDNMKAIPHTAAHFPAPRKQPRIRTASPSP